MKLTHIGMIACIALIMTSCISKKKLETEQQRYQDLTQTYTQSQSDLKDCLQKQEESARKKAFCLK